MRSRSLQHRQSFRDLRRLVALPDLGPWLGDIILRKSFKITAITGGAALFGSLTRQWGGHGPNLKEAASMTLSVGLGLMGLGFMLKISPIFIRKARGIAEASQINLLENVKKYNAPEHLKLLWDRVCQYEIVSSPEVQLKEMAIIQEAKRRCCALAPHWVLQGFDESMVRERIDHPHLCLKSPVTQDGFVLSALYHLNHPHPSQETLPDYKVCLDLYANYLDGAPFHSSDTKLQEEGEHDLQLKSIRIMVYRGLSPAWLAPLSCLIMNTREAWVRMPQKVWFPLCMRAISSRVGQALSQLDQAYPHVSLDALHLMWPGSEKQKWILTVDGLKESLVDMRKKILIGIFGPNLEGAQRMLDRMLLPNAEIATELRYRFDPDYCHGQLNDQLDEDLVALNCSPRYLHFHRSQCLRRAKRLDQFCCFVEKHCPDLVEDPEHYLILRCAHHTRSMRVDRLMRRSVGLDTPHTTDLVEFRLRCERALELSPSLRQRLLYIRTYQTLSMISITDYRQHLEDLFVS